MTLDVSVLPTGGAAAAWRGGAYTGDGSESLRPTELRVDGTLVHGGMFDAGAFSFPIGWLAHDDDAVGRLGVADVDDVGFARPAQLHQPLDHVEAVTIGFT